MTFEFLIFQVALINVVSGLEIKWRPVNCRVEELLGVQVGNYCWPLLFKNLINFLEPKWENFSIFIAEFAKEAGRFGHKMAAEEFVAGERVFQILGNLGHTPACVKFSKRVVCKNARFLTSAVDGLNQVLECLTEDSAIEALTGQVFILI